MQLAIKNQFQMRTDEPRRMVIVIAKCIETIMRRVDGKAHLGAVCRDEIDDTLSACRVDDARECKSRIRHEAIAHAFQVIAVGGKEVAHHEVIERGAVFESPYPVFNCRQAASPAFSSRNGMKLPYSPRKKRSG